MKIPLSKPYIGAEEIKAVEEVLRSNVLSMGERVSRFEETFSEFIGKKYGVAVNSGTSGLHLAVKAFEIGPGDEVLTTPFSFIASANCLLYEGAQPVFVDVEEDSLGMDPEQVESKVTDKTVAILPVHVFGQPCNMGEIERIAKKHSLKIIEDACESIGSKYQGVTVGSIGDMSVFGFYPNKQITTGEGGMVLTDDENKYQLLKSLRNQGRGESMQWLSHDRIGYNYRMSEISAAIGIEQVKKLHEVSTKRRAVAREYLQELANIDEIKLPNTFSDRTHSWFVFAIRVKQAWRDKVIEELQKVGIQSKAYFYPCIHLQKFYREKFGYSEGDFPIAEKLSKEIIALPFFTDMGEGEIQYVCRNLKRIIRELGRS